MGTHTITSAKEVASEGGDTLQLILSFTGTALSDDNFTFAELGLRVSDWGEVDTSYDLEDALLVPGIYSVEICDELGALQQYFFGSAGDHAETVEKTAGVELKRNGQTEYVGNVQEDGIDFDAGDKLFRLTVDSDTSLLNKLLLYNDDGSPINPLGLADNTWYLVLELLEKIYQVIDPSINLQSTFGTIFHDWLFWGQRDPDLVVKDDLTFRTLYQYSHPLFFDSQYGLTNLGDVLKKLAIDWCSFTGLLNKKYAFFRKLYAYNADNQQTLGMVLSRKFGYRYTTIDFVKSIFLLGDGSIYTAGTDTHIEDRRIERKMMPQFYYGHASPPNAFSNIMARSGVDWYWVFKVKDAAIDGGAWKDLGRLTADYWYEKRSKIYNGRVDLITVRGINYSFLADFTDDGRKYQPIGMRKKLSENLTEIEALFLGWAT